MKSADLWKEFKGFALKGNVIDLAVAVVIGTAFGAVVNSLVKNVLMPAFSYVLPSEASYRHWMLGKIEIGVFLGELLNFVVIALVMYLIMVRLAAGLRSAGLIPAGPATTKPCPFCLSVIPALAKKCAHCTADLPAEP
jgi:large conductance mechanosensitive channel